MSAANLSLTAHVEQLGEISTKCDIVETRGIELYHFSALLRLLCEDARRLGTYTANWQHVHFIACQLETTGHEIETESKQAMDSADALYVLAREGGAQ
jgi:hypothetical protein